MNPDKEPKQEPTEEQPEGQKPITKLDLMMLACPEELRAYAMECIMALAESKKRKIE